LADDAARRGQDVSRAAQRPIVELTDGTHAPLRQQRQEISPEDAAAASASSDVGAPLDGTTGRANPPSDGREAGVPGTNDSSPSVGGSQATSANPRTNPAEQQNPERSGATDAATPRRGGDGSPVAGVGRAARSNEGQTDALGSGGVVTHVDSSQAPAAAPWSSGAWQQTVESAEQQVRSGRVPDDARDLVRGYFDPGASGR
jgi:hypothetical protein